MPQSSIALDVDGLSKRFDSAGGPVLALDRTSFQVPDGQILSIVGTSGCGKSTLLSMVAGLETPTTGEMTLYGRPLERPGMDRGMVFQRDCLFPWLSVRDNVRFSLSLDAFRGSGEAFRSALERSDHLIDVVGLAGFRDAYPSQLSGGMRQRAAIARALVTRPPMLLMDEPFGALDAQTREQMQTLLLRICAAQRTTVLFVTHDVEEAVFLGDRVLVLAAHPGRVIEDMPIDLERPRPATIRLASSFGEYRRAILDLLHGQQDDTPPEDAIARIADG